MPIIPTHSPMHHRLIRLSRANKAICMSHTYICMHTSLALCLYQYGPLCLPVWASMGPYAYQYGPVWAPMPTSMGQYGPCTYQYGPVWAPVPTSMGPVPTSMGQYGPLCLPVWALYLPIRSSYECIPLLLVALLWSSGHTEVGCTRGN